MQHANRTAAHRATGALLFLVKGTDNMQDNIQDGLLR